jgi:hypothetical protein
MTLTLKPISDHPSVKTIRRSVSKLNRPALNTLLGVFLDVKNSVELKNSEIRNKIGTTKQEGWEAAARLMAPAQRQVTAQPQTYFDSIESKRRGKK